MTRAAPCAAALLVFALGCGGDDDGGSDASAGSDSGSDAGGGGGDAGPGCVPEADRCEEMEDCCDGLVCRGDARNRFCVHPDDTCFVGAEEGCCLDDADCPGDERCHLSECRLMGDGVCKPEPPDGECWSPRDCNSGMVCEGAIVCDCMGSCAEPDSPGTCAAP